jgi:hypothetical protein
MERFSARVGCRCGCREKLKCEQGCEALEHSKEQRDDMITSTRTLDDMAMAVGKLDPAEQESRGRISNGNTDTDT